MNQQDIRAKALLRLGALSVVVDEDLTFSIEPEDLDVSDLQALELTLALDVAKEARIAFLRTICGATIVGGFASDALGEPHTYPSDVTAQINLMGSIMDSILPGLAEDWATPFWTEDSAGNWAFRPHTPSQIQQAGRDGKVHVVVCQSILEGLSAQVIAAETVEDVASIVWPEGVNL